MIDQAELERQFRGIGLQAGDGVVVHSSLRSIGRVDGGAPTVVRALLSVLGPEGLLVAPTFNFRESRFDPAVTPSRMGVISETIRTWPGAVRSWQPTHAVAAIGEGAEALTAGHHLVGGGLSVDSPLDRLAALGGWVLLLGVGHNRNSTIHVGEAHAGVPHMHVPYGPDGATRVPISVNGDTVIVELRDFPGCSEAFGAVEGEMRRRGFIHDRMVGGASMQLMRGADLISTVVDLLQDDPTLLLCTSTACSRCPDARAMLASSAGHELTANS